LSSLCNERPIGESGGGFSELFGGSIGVNPYSETEKIRDSSRRKENIRPIKSGGITVPVY
jgi:hypothetical protein